MRTFLNVPLLDTNCSYQMFAHHYFLYSEQVEDIEHYNASIGGEFDAKMNSFMYIKWFLRTFGKFNSTEWVLEMTFMLTNISNGFHEISVQ